MKYAPIANRFDLPAMWHLRGGYDFALAHEVDRWPVLQEYFTLKHQSGAFIILDNGAAEDERVPFAKLLQIANNIHADEIALPDVLKNAALTFALHTDGAMLALIEPRRRMIIPQGDSVDEWKASLDDLDHALEGRYATIGVPKHMERFEQGRVKCIEHIARKGLHRLHYIHALGIYGPPLFEVRQLLYAHHDIVRGVDSAAPFAYSQHDEILDNDLPHRSYDWTRGGNPVISHRNLDLMYGVCNGK